jgi:DnaJ-class molecular chaperone
MDENELSQLYTDCEQSDPQAAQLLDAYMNRRFADWNEANSSGDNSNGKTRGMSDGPISREEAYEILGLESGAGKLEIRRAHRKLMKKLHPDQGGSTYLAAKINEAKDLLLG